MDRIPALSQPGVDPVVDVAALRDRYEEDMDLFQEIIRLFLTDHPRQMAEIRQAIASGNAADLASLSHKLKGALGNFFARPACAAVARLETMGQQKNLAMAEEACVCLEREIYFLQDTLRQLADTLALMETRA
jgi:HPt (histidine-containing phosphotransfer) domain-containing protein